MRRIVVTPTFAAGLGVVIMAVVAYPMARTVFRYSAPDEQPCHVKRCGTGTRGNQPALATAQPGYRILDPSGPRHSATSPPAARPTPTVQGAPSTSRPSQPPGDQPVMTFQILHQVQGGFGAVVTIHSRSGQSTGDWRLAFTYPSGRVTSVRGGTLVSHDSHHAVVTGTYHGSYPGWQDVHIEVNVSGPAGPPASCVFNGNTCQIVMAGQGSGGSGYSGGGSQPSGGGQFPGGY